MINRIETTVSLTLLTAVLTMGFVLVDGSAVNAADGDSSTMAKLADKVDGDAPKSAVNEEPAATTAKRAADRALERELKKPAPQPSGAITSLSTLSDGPSDSAVLTASSSNFGNRSRGYSAWRKTSEDSSAEQVATKKTLPQHAPPKRTDGADDKKQTAPAQAVKAAPAKPASPPAAKAAPAQPVVKAAPAPKPAVKATAAPSSVSSVTSKSASISKSAVAASVTPESPVAKKSVAAASTTSESSKSATSPSSTPASTESRATRSWRSRISVTPKATSSPEPKAEAKPAPKPAPVVAASTTKSVAAKSAAVSTSKSSSSVSKSAPAATKSEPVVVAAGKQGATRGGVAMQPSVTENPPAGGSLIARGAKGGAPNIMRVLTGKSIMVDLAKDAKRVAVANPKVAEVLIITPQQVMVNGLADGETSIIIWDRAGNYTMSTVVVGDDLADQVMLEVTVAEINRSAMERHGVDYRNFGGQFNSITQYGGVAPTSGAYPPSQSDPPFPVSLDGGISWAVIDAKNNIAVLFKQLQDENLGRVLAEPKLLSRSGKEANFLSGGEIPIVVTTNDDTSIEFKEFGTKVNFTPSVREDGSIDLHLETEVSEPDYAAGVQLFGFQVPAFITRRSATEVTLRDNQSLIIAGLIKETKQELESKMPFVGDIPVLGYFFRRTEYMNDILELVMVVKPHLVKPIAEGTRVSLPTDRGPLTKQEVRTGPVEEKVVRPRPY